MNITDRKSLNGNHFLNDLDRLFSSAFRPAQSVPSQRAVKSYEDEHGWTLRIELPGFSKEQVELDLKEQILSINANAPEGDQHLHSWQQRFALPDGADLSKLTAQLEHGVLVVSLPKAEPNEPEVRRIDIN